MKIYVDAYLSKNLGDDLFINILTKRYPQHKFYAISKGEKGYNTKNFKVYSNTYIFKILKKFQWEKYLANHYDTVVTIGGSMFMERGDTNRDFSMGKNKRYVLGINFGPYKTQEYYNNIYNMLSDVEDVCFRDKYSYNLFKELPNARQAADIVFSMDTSNIKITNRKRAIISIISPKDKIDEKYEEKYEEKMLELITFLIKKEYEICLMSFCKNENDEEEIEKIYSQIPENQKKKVEKYYYNGNIEEALNTIADSQLVVGGRFHANIIGLCLGKSILPVLYSDKTLHVLEDMQINTPIIDIRKLENFNIESIKDEDLTRHYNIEKQKEDAQRHFEKLDIQLIN
ncbi:MAG: hypothetical protein BHW01_07380 [Clostridium sp. 27_14]|nr:MAG: hypothetical protein BHW01_07380 [Clostridium sp. 27_14]